MSFPSYTAVKLRGDDIHMACMTVEEVGAMAVFFYQPDSTPDKPCLRCGVNLRETPDP